MTVRLVLVGPPGAGKTTVGRLLAERWAVAFRDTDADIEAAAGKTISDIFVDDGEPVFRAMERDAVAAALAEHDGVLALGGGAVLDPSTQQRLAGHPVVFLDVGLADAVSRIGLYGGRPLVAGNPRARLKLLLDERRPTYVKVALLTVDTTGRPVENVVQEIMDHGF